MGLDVAQALRFIPGRHALIVATSKRPVQVFFVAAPQGRAAYSMGLNVQIEGRADFGASFSNDGLGVFLARR